MRRSSFPINAGGDLNLLTRLGMILEYYGMKTLHAFDPVPFVFACCNPTVLVGVDPLIFWLPWLFFFLLLIFIHICWRPKVLSSWAKRWQLKSIRACKHVCQLMHKHVQARCQLKELFGSIIYSATDFLVVPKAILPRRVLSMVFFLGHLHHLLMASCCRCCWVLHGPSQWPQLHHHPGTPPACKVNPETNNSRRRLLGRRHLLSFLKYNQYGAGDC